MSWRVEKSILLPLCFDHRRRRLVFQDPSPTSICLLTLEEGGTSESAATEFVPHALDAGKKAFICEQSFSAMGILAAWTPSITRYCRSGSHNMTSDAKGREREEHTKPDYNSTAIASLFTQPDVLGLPLMHMIFHGIQFYHKGIRNIISLSLIIYTTGENKQQEVIHEQAHIFLVGSVLHLPSYACC